MMAFPLLCLLFFFFNDTATTEIYTLSLHDALPISLRVRLPRGWLVAPQPRRTIRIRRRLGRRDRHGYPKRIRSEEHTSELQSRLHLVCRLLLAKKMNV